MSALNNIGKKMLGFADEFMEGASKGVSKNIRVNSLKSNMTKSQLKNLNLKSGREAAIRTAANRTGKSVNEVSQAMANGQRVTFGKGNLNLSNKQTILNNKVNPTLGNKMGDAMIGGYRDMYRSAQSSLAGGAGYKDAIRQGFNAGFRNTNGTLNTARVAGGIATAGVAARVATGGGLYKDRYGNNNLIGVPFI
jgi:hypothetical protein